MSIHWYAIEELSEIIRYWEDAACVWGGSVSGADPRPRRYPRDVASTAQRVDWRGKVTASPRETALMLLASRAADASVCPSEVARAIAPEGWRAAMPSVHAAIDRLVEEGRDFGAGPVGAHTVMLNLFQHPFVLSCCGPWGAMDPETRSG